MTTKPELIELADERNVEVGKSDSKRELVEKLDAAGVSDPKLDEARAELDDGDQSVDQSTSESIVESIEPVVDEAERNAEVVEGGSPHLIGGVAAGVRTAATPAADDEAPAVIGDAKVDDGTVRTNSAVEPVAGSLVAGAGAPSGRPSNVDRDGREVFPDGVAPTARADYDGPNAPVAQRSGEGYPDAAPADDESDDES